ncbi:MAG: hypothetical protein O9297_14335 [Flavobacterium sp.]|uniref:hypothetical protein n=1 Tax=Flavobacterium sp. TaxID=239 RepID=UPI0022C6D223|nr:hypothetical protein [Flavobacterium sp.]MCZ8298385.1 hypothetical protein [Flavobacterium sp.]
MKITFLSFIIIFSASVYSQEKKKKYDFAFSPELISQKDLFGGANLLIGRVVNEKMIIGMSGVRIGVESNLKNNSDLIIAPKVGFETSGTILIMRFSAVNYFQNTKSEFRLLPEIGLSWGGFVNLTYGYNFRITNKQINDLSGHRFCLSFNLNRKLIKEGLPRM